MRAVFYNTAGLGHLNPTLPLVRQLVSDGYEVLYYSSEERRAVLEAAGATLLAYEAPRFDTETYNPGTLFPNQLFPATAALLPKLLADLEELRPDLLVYDSMSPWGRAVADLSGLPAICQISTFALNAREKAAMFQANGAKLDPRSEAALGALAREYGLHFEWPDALGAYGNFNLVNTIPYLQPPLGYLPRDRFHFLGAPLTVAPAPTPERRWFRSERKKVLLSLGTVAGALTERLFHLTAALRAGGDVELLFTFGGAPLPAALAKEPGVHSFLNQTEALREADLFVTHAGMNSVHEGLATECPLLCLPLFGDQFLNARRVEELGLGTSLDLHTCSPAAFAAAVRALLGDHHVQRSVAIVGGALSEAAPPRIPLPIISGANHRHAPNSLAAPGAAT